MKIQSCEVDFATETHTLWINTGYNPALTHMSEQASGKKIQRIGVIFVHMLD